VSAVRSLCCLSSWWSASASLPGDTGCIITLYVLARWRWLF
jgi:hypothetical protein